MSDNLVKSITVLIEGDKEGFNSKTAQLNFKSYVKSNSTFTVDELSKRFIKDTHKLILVSYSDNRDEFKFNLKLKEETDLSNVNANAKAKSNAKDYTIKKNELLKAKLKLMRDERTNMSSKRSFNDDNVTDDIREEYLKAKKMCKIPIPEPSEILSKPDEYKPLVSMVLSNHMMRELGPNHPYVKYFKLIAAKLNVDENTIQSYNSPQLSQTNNMEEMMKQSANMMKKPELTKIKAKDINIEEDSETEESEEDLTI